MSGGIGRRVRPSFRLPVGTESIEVRHPIGSTAASKETKQTDAVKLEAEKATPDVGKLKRWGDKFIKVSEDVGLKVVSGTIAGLLLKMYTG